MKQEIRRQPEPTDGPYVERILQLVGEDSRIANYSCVVPFRDPYDKRPAPYAIVSSELDGDGNAPLTALYVCASDDARLDASDDAGLDAEVLN